MHWRWWGRFPISLVLSIGCFSGLLGRFIVFSALRWAYLIRKGSVIASQDIWVANGTMYESITCPAQYIDPFGPQNK